MLTPARMQCKYRSRPRRPAAALLCAAACLLAPAAASATTPAWTLSRLAGISGSAGAPVPGSALSSTLDTPDGVAFGEDGSMYIADTGNCTIEKVDADTGVLSVIAGDTCSSGSQPSWTPGSASAVKLGLIESLAVAPDGDVYMTDQTSDEVYELTTNGMLSVVAGGGATSPSPTAEPANDAELQYTQAVTVDAAGDVYIADYYAVDELTPDGNITEIAGTADWTGSHYASTTPVTATDTDIYPVGIAVDNAGHVFVTDDETNTIDEISGGQLWTVAGDGSSGPATPGAADASALGFLGGLTVSANGNLFFADSGNDTIDELSGGQLSIIAGTQGVQGSPSAGPADGTDLNAPYDVALDPAGAIAIADTDDDTIDGITPAPPTNAAAPTISGSATEGSVLTATAGEWSYATTATLTYQWERCDGNSCVPINGATGTTYTVAAADAGSELEVVVTATNAGGSTAQASQPTTIVPTPSTTTSSGNTPSPGSGGGSGTGNTPSPGGGGGSGSSSSPKSPTNKPTTKHKHTPAPKTRTVPSSARASVRVSTVTLATSTASAKSGSVRVGCSLSHAVFSGCSTVLTATVDGSTVVVGRGTVRGATHHLVVTNHLTAEGLALANRPGGLKVNVAGTMKARGVRRELHADGSTQLTLSHVLVVPSDGTFASGSSVIEPSSIPYLSRLRGELGGARSISCVGYTDSVGTATSNLALGRARAQAVCSYLTAGSKIHTTTTSRGAADPRASNATPGGRALNRRVEVHINY